MLFAKVVLALMLGRPAERYLDIQRAAHLQRMRELTELKRTATWSTPCSPTTACSTWKPTCAGSTSPRPGWTYSHEEVKTMIIEARDVEKSFGQTPALRGASVGRRAARSWPSWARAVRASRPCCTAWPAS